MRLTDINLWGNLYLYTLHMYLKYINVICLQILQRNISKVLMKGVEAYQWTLLYTKHKSKSKYKNKRVKTYLSNATTKPNLE